MFLDWYSGWEGVSLVAGLFLGHCFSLLCIHWKPSVKPDIMLHGVEAKTHECGLALLEQTRIVQETEKKRLASVFGVMPVNRVVHTPQGSSTENNQGGGRTWVGLTRNVNTCTGQPLGGWLGESFRTERREGETLKGHHMAKGIEAWLSNEERPGKKPERWPRVRFWRGFFVLSRCLGDAQCVPKESPTVL